MSLDKPKFKIHNKYESPENIDYDLLGLHKKRTIVTGELRTIEYYRNFDGVTYSDLVLRESRTYVRNAFGLVLYRILYIEWYLTDDSIGCTKTTTKFYSSQESIDEGITRRNNIIATAKIYVLNSVGQSNAYDLLADVKDKIVLYSDGYKQPLLDAITNSVKPYLTQPIKDDIIEILTF